MIEIVDPRDHRRYKIKDLRVIYHNLPDKQGKMKRIKCVEYTVIGKNHEWSFWLSYEAFINANPHITI